MKTEKVNNETPFVNRGSNQGKRKIENIQRRNSEGKWGIEDNKRQNKRSEEKSLKERRKEEDSKWGEEGW